MPGNLFLKMSIHFVPFKATKMNLFLRKVGTGEIN